MMSVVRKLIKFPVLTLYMSETSREYWLAQKWGKLCLDTNQEIHPRLTYGTHRKFKFLCDCGREITAELKSVTSGHTFTCRKCEWKTKEHWLAQEWGKLRLDPSQPLPEEWGPRVSTKYIFICNCTNTKIITWHSVASGHTSTCGECDWKPKDYWLSQKWGELMIHPSRELPDKWSPQSRKNIPFLCNCNRTTTVAMYNITSGNTTSCGMCKWKPKEYWLAQKWGKLKLDPNQGLPNEWGTGAEMMVKLVCDCGNHSESLFSNLSNGGVTSCKCLKIGENENSPENEVRRFVLSIVPDTYPKSWTIPGTRKSYDVYVPSRKFAIEYHGLIYHSERLKSGERDHEKLLQARERGDRLIQVYSDEWKDKQEIIKAQIRSILCPEKGLRIKPDFSYERKASSDVHSFLDSHHYLGAASGCLTILARHPKSNEIIGVWVFMKREAGTVLWHRACWDHRYKAWNPHEKALRMAMPILKEMGFKRILTFSDNRFHTGEMYEKIGFKFEKELKPDYSYTNGKVRKSKYALRVKAGTDEIRSAAENGWYRIWDSGKKRYSITL